MAGLTTMSCLVFSLSFLVEVESKCTGRGVEKGGRWKERGKAYGRVHKWNLKNYKHV